MIFRQITHDDLGCASYLIGDEKAGIAAVVDPKLEIDEYLRLARYLGVRIEHIFETHNHADHVSGHGRLAAATGATIHVHRLAEPDYDHAPFEDGETFELGALRVEALHTPGHRPEHTAFALYDTRRDGEHPWAVLTGDTLFVGDVARPDLAIEKRDGARGIFESLHKLLRLPPQTEVWPGHLGGSMCGGPGMDMKVSTTIGFEAANNAVLSIADVGDFVEQSVAKLGPQPPNFQNIVALNRGPLSERQVEPQPLTPRQVDDLRRQGALLVDVRTDRQYDDAHVPGAVCITSLRAGFGTKLAWLATPGQPLVMIGRDDDDARHAITLAAAVGLSAIGGYLAGGMTSWREEGRQVEHVERITVPELKQRVDDDEDLQLLDVREAAEWQTGHIPDATHRPYHDITTIPDGLDPRRPIAAICASGQRAAVAAGLLKRAGATQVLHVVPGGVATWRELDGPIAQPA